MTRFLMVVAGCAVFGIAGCASGVTGPATDVTSNGATLRGQVLSNTGAPAEYWFEWVVSRCCQGQTPTRTVNFENGAEAGASREVTEVFTGPVSGASYYYRLCAADDDNPDDPVCGDVQTFTATPPP